MHTQAGRCQNALSATADWRTCEVLSTGTQKVDKTIKLPKSHVWLVEPIDRTLEVLRLVSDGKYLFVVTHADDVGVRAAPFDAIELGLSVLWGISV